MSLSGFEPRILKTAVCPLDYRNQLKLDAVIQLLSYTVTKINKKNVQKLNNTISERYIHLVLIFLMIVINNICFKEAHIQYSPLYGSSITRYVHLICRKTVYIGEDVKGICCLLVTCYEIV